uniref:Ribonuclease H-like domain-containing protein n=1 Tax=Tanacetum cinerariifolium TaxID=118510 RepID=A0A6L2MEM7_TANCI|nr:ribonuclease H-like domain-containing protein [Tanacetum cinerariifolium]
MKMEQYLAHTDYALWEVILNGNSAVQMTKDEAESTTNTNELNAAYSVSTATSHRSQAQGSHAFYEGKRFYKKTGRKLEFNGKEPVGFDKTKVECFNYHRRGHFTRDCRSIRNSRNMSRDAGNAGYRGRDNGKRLAKEEDEKSLVVQDGLGTYDWSYQVEEEATDFALMDFTSNPSSSSSSNSEENSLANDRFKKGKGYHAVPPPLTGNYMPPKSDLSFSRLDDSIYTFKISETFTSVTKYEKDALETSTACVDKPKADRSSAPLIQDWDSDNDNDRKATGHRESRLVWNNIQRINHHNKFAPTAVFTRSGRIPVSAAKPKAATSTSAAKPVNTADLNRVVNTVVSKAVSAVKGNGVTAVKTSACCVWRLRVNEIDQLSKDNRWIYTRVDYGHPHQALKNKRIVDSGCSRHMTRNKTYLADYQKINDEGFVAFGSSKGKIGKGKIRTEKLDFDDVYFVNEIQFNLFSVSQMYDKKNSVLFTEAECLVLSPNFKLLDESQVLLRIPRQSNMYNFDLQNVVLLGI